MKTSNNLIVYLIDSYQMFQDALVRNNYDEAAQAAASALKEIDAFKRAQSNAGIRNRCMDQDELVLINSMTAGFKIFVTIAQVELKQISIHQVVLAQLKNQIVMAYGSKIFLGMFRLVCENLTLLFLRGNYFRLARMFLLLTFQYYADIEMNKDRERIFFERIGIRISTVYKVGMESAKVKSELIYLMDLFDISQVHYNQGFEISDIIIANESIFDGLLEEMKVKCTSYQVPIFIKSPAQAKALYALINRKLELMKFNYEQLDPNDPVIKMFNTKEQGLMWCKFWTGLNSKFLCSFVDMPDKINLLENSIEHWNELRTEKFLVKEFASEHRIIYSRCLREIIFYYDCKIFLKLDTIKNSSRREAQDAIEEINNFHLHSIEISLELLKFAEKNPDYSSDHLTMLLNLASAYRSLIYDGKKKRAKMIHKSTMYINKAVKMLKETHLPGLSICIHATDCQPCRALLDVQTKEESVNLLIAQIENTWYLKKFRDAAVTETSEVDIDNVFEMLNQFEKYVERIVTRITCGCQESVAWETIETYVNEALTLYEEFKQRHHNVDELGQAKLTAMETHFKFFEMSIQVRRNKCLMKDLDFRKLKVLLLEGYKDKAKPCYFLACEKLIHLLIQFQHFRMARVVLMVALDVKKELLKQIKPAINSIEHRCLCLQVQFVSYLFLYTSRDLKKEKNGEIVEQETVFDSQLDDVLETLSLRDYYAIIPKEIKTFDDFDKLNKVLSTHLNVLEKTVMKECGDDLALVNFRKESTIYFKYWRALQFKEMSTCKENEHVEVDLILKSLKAFEMLKRDHFKMSDIRLDLRKHLVGKSESVYNNLLACNVDNYVKIVNTSKNILLGTPLDIQLSDLSKMSREHNALTKDAIVWCKEYLSFINMPESIASSCVKVENFYFVAQMYRCLIETNLEKQTRNLNNSLLHVKKIVEIIEKETNSEALDWLCKIMLKERNDLRFLLPKDLSQNKKEQLFVDEIDQDPFVLRFRKVS